MTIASRVSAADKCQSGKLSSDRILYCHDFILYVLQLEYVLTTSVFSFATLHVTQNSVVYILKMIGAEIEEKLVVELIKMLRCVVRSFNQLNIINAKYYRDGGALVLYAYVSCVVR